MSDWTTLAALALAVAAASFTVARTKITARMRDAVAARSSWLGGLLGCPYCLSHWLAAIAVGIYQPRVTNGPLWADLGVSWLATVAASAVAVGLIGNAIAPGSPAPLPPRRPR